MKVMHIELGRHLYGGAKQVTYLIKGIHQHLHEQPAHLKIEQVLVCPEHSDIAQVELAECITCAITYRGECDFRALKQIKHLIRKHQVSIVHVHSRRGADVWGLLAANQCGVPVVCTRRVDNPEGVLAAIKYRRYQAVASISQGVQEVVKKHCPLDQPQPVIFSAVDFDDYHYSADRAWLNAEFAIPAHHAVVANFAQLIERKGQADLINAMKSVIAHCPDTTCLLFGKGKMAAHYQSLIEQYQLQNHIKLCGFSDHVARILPSVDVVAHPAYAEGLGVILLQAAAAKRAVVAYGAGGIPEVIHNQITGLLCTSGDTQRLAANIIQLLQSTELRIQLGEQLYSHAKQHFSISTMSQEYIKLYQALSEDSHDSPIAQ